MPNPSRLARAQIKEIKSRWKMWGVEGNKECRAIEADFCSDPDVVKALQKADLVVSLDLIQRKTIRMLIVSIVDSSSTTMRSPRH